MSCFAIISIKGKEPQRIDVTDNYNALDEYISTAYKGYFKPTETVGDMVTNSNFLKLSEGGKTVDLNTVADELLPNIKHDDKVVFYAEKERNGTWDSKSKMIVDENGNKWGVTAILSDKDGYIKVEQSLKEQPKIETEKPAGISEITKLKSKRTKESNAIQKEINKLQAELDAIEDTKANAKKRAGLKSQIIDLERKRAIKVEDYDKQIEAIKAAETKVESPKKVSNNYGEQTKTEFENAINYDLDTKLDDLNIKKTFPDFEVGQFPSEPVILYRGVREPELNELLGSYDEEKLNRDYQEPLERALAFDKYIKGGEFNSKVERNFGASFAGKKESAIQAAKAIRRGYTPTGEEFIFGGKDSPKYVITVDAQGLEYGVLRKEKFKGEDKIDISEFDIARGINIKPSIRRIIKIEKINDDGSLTDVSDNYGKFIKDNIKQITEESGGKEDVTKTDNNVSEKVQAEEEVDNTTKEPTVVEKSGSTSISIAVRDKIKEYFDKLTGNSDLFVVSTEKLNKVAEDLGLTDNAEKIRTNLIESGELVLEDEKGKPC